MVDATGIAFTNAFGADAGAHEVEDVAHLRIAPSIGDVLDERALSVAATRGQSLDRSQ